MGCAVCAFKATFGVPQEHTPREVRRGRRRRPLGEDEEWEHEERDALGLLVAVTKAGRGLMTTASWC